MNLTKAALAGFAIILSHAFADAAAAETVLRFTGMDAGAGTVDPHASNLSAEKGATKQIYEALVDIDSNLAIVPQLAVGWKIVDATHWDFELRQGVRFHDGTPFTAADVIFSIERARAENADLHQYVDGIGRVEAIDDHTVRFTTIAPDPSLWMKLAEVAIVSKDWAEEHGATKPADFLRARKENYASRHANGTGPFMLEAFEPYGRWVLVRNPDWWGQTITRTTSTASFTSPRAMTATSALCSTARSICFKGHRTRPSTAFAAHPG